VLSARIRRSVAIVLGLAFAAMLAASPVAAQTDVVTGTLVMRTREALSPTAVAVITLVDRSKDGSGTIIGQQRIDAPPPAAIPFSVPYDTSAVNDKHSYMISASVVDGTNEWQNPTPVPTITGGPTEGLTVELVAPDYANPASVTGTITLPADVVLTPAAVAYAAVVNTTSGRIVVRQVIPSPTTFPIPYTVAYDADLVDPEAQYAVAAAVIDGAVLYQTETATPLAPGAVLDLAVVQRDQEIPGPASPAPSLEPTPTTALTLPPTSPSAPAESATPKPTKTPKPTPTTPAATPTAAATGTPAPTAPPTAPPPATATPAVTEPPAVTPTPPTAAPATSNPTSVTGTLVYREHIQLTDVAVAEIAVVQVVGRNHTVVVVGRQTIKNPGQVPIAFDVALDQSVLDTSVDTELWALITDGDNAWTTAEGVAVATNGAPSQNVLVPLTFRPDLMEGVVTGTVTGAGTDLSPDAISVTWLLDSTTLAIVGFDSSLASGLDPIPFSVPFSVADLDRTQAYEIQAFVYDGPNTWTTNEGIPVITNGNPLSDIVATVSQITPFPSATPGPSLAPSPSPAPTTPPATGGGGIDPLWILLIGVAVGAAVIGGIYVMRRNSSS